MKSSDLLDLDLSGREFAQLVDAIAHRQGAGLANAASLLDAAVLIRSPWAPGLRFVGGMLKALDGSGHVAAARNVGGAGEQLVDAFVSCLGETIERDAQMRAPLPVIRRAWPETPQTPFENSVARLLALFGGNFDRQAAKPLAWVEGRTLDDEPALVPIDWCLRRAEPERSRIPGAALSVGCAAGPTPEMAAMRALLELVERDAAALWWIGGRRPRRVSQDVQTHADEMLKSLRGGSAERATILLDITTDMAMPVMVAISTDRHGGLFAAGLGARTTRAGAARAAVLELCQMEVGLQLAQLKREQAGEAALSDDDRRHLLRAARIDVATDLRFKADVALQGPNGDDGPGDLARVGAAFRSAGITAALVELTRPGGVPVFKAIAPDLQLLPSDIATPRLESLVAENFPGGRADLDIPLV